MSGRRKIRDRYEFEHWVPTGSTVRGSTVSTIDIRIKSTQDVGIQEIGRALDEAVARIKHSIGVRDYD